MAALALVMVVVVVVVVSVIVLQDAWSVSDGTVEEESGLWLLR